MKKRVIFLLATTLALSLCSCAPASNDEEDTVSPSEESTVSPSEEYHAALKKSSSSSNDDDYDYDEGYGYTAPKEGQSVSDYIKEQDPELYDSMKDIYDSAVSDSSNSNDDDYDYDKGYGYTAPKEGQSFSDYVKEQDPELYDSLFN